MGLDDAMPMLGRRRDGYLLSPRARRVMFDAAERRRLMLPMIIRCFEY